MGGILNRLGRLGDGRRSLTLLGYLDRVRAKRFVATVVLADRRFGTSRYLQAHPVAGLTAVCGRTTVLADADAIPVTRLGDGCCIARPTRLADGDAVLGKDGGYCKQKEWGKDKFFHGRLVSEAHTGPLMTTTSLPVGSNRQEVTDHMNNLKKEEGIGLVSQRVGGW